MIRSHGDTHLAGRQRPGHSSQKIHLMHSYSCYFISGRSSLTHFLVWFEEFYKVLGIKYQTKSLLHASHFSTTKLYLQAMSPYFKDSMNYTTVYMLSYWKLSTNILGVSKGTFMKKIFPNQIIISHIKW